MCWFFWELLPPRKRILQLTCDWWHWQQQKDLMDFLPLITIPASDQNFRQHDPSKNFLRWFNEVCYFAFHVRQSTPCTRKWCLILGMTVKSQTFLESSVWLAAFFYPFYLINILTLYKTSRREYCFHQHACQCSSEWYTTTGHQDDTNKDFLARKSCKL